MGLNVNHTIHTSHSDLMDLKSQHLLAYMLVSNDTEL